MVLSLNPASDAESHALDEAEPAERPLFADAETAEDVSEGGRLSDSAADKRPQSGDTSRF